MPCISVSHVTGTLPARGLCAVCHGGAVVERVLWQCGEPACGVVLGPNGGPAGHGAPSGGVGFGHGRPRTDARAVNGRAGGLAVGARGRWRDGAVSPPWRWPAGE